MAWKHMETQAHFDRYKRQPGVNVFSLYDPACDPEEKADIESSLHKEYAQEAQANEIRFYYTTMKLSDSGGGLMVYHNGKKLEHKGVLPGAIKPLKKAIEKGLALEAEDD